MKLRRWLSWLVRPLRHLWPRGLGGQLMATVLAVVWLSLAGFGTLAVRWQAEVSGAALTAQAATLAHNLALGSEGWLVLGDLDALQQLVRRAAELPEVQRIAILDARGAQVVGVERQPGQKPQLLRDAQAPPQALPGVEQAHTDLADPQRVRAWQPMKAGTLLGWMRVDLGTEALLAQRQRTTQGLLAACLLAALVAALALHLVLRSPLRAIGQARDFAEGLQTIEGQQMAALRGPQETRQLAHSLNRASTRLLQMRQAEEASRAEMRRNKAALAGTNEQLRTIFTLSPDGLVCLDAEDRVSFINPIFQRMTGLAPAQVLGQPAAVLEARLRTLCADLADFPGLQAFFEPAGEAAAHRLTLALPRHTVLDVVGAHSEVPAVRRLLYLRDITHESEVDRMKSEFLSTAAHELRTPMTSIHACIELLLSREYAVQRRTHLLGVMQRQSSVLMRVVNDLLDLARIEARGAVEIGLQDLSLQALLTEAVHDFALPIGRQPPQRPEGAADVLVRTDPHKVAQVLRNLLSNAYKYSPPEAAVALLTVLDTAAGRAGFVVQDHGVGMTEEQLARVGERFYRADATGQVAGTGLGVSIVRELLALLGGALELHSRPGEGTRATVWLPLAKAGTPSAPSAAPAPADQQTLATIAAT